MEDIIIKHPRRVVTLQYYQDAIDDFTNLGTTRDQFGCKSVQALVDKIKEQDAEIKRLKNHSSIPDFTKDDL